MTAVNRIAIALLCLTCLPLSSTLAQDWNQWMGKDRDGVFRETGIIDSIPESGLKVKWRMPVNGGYAGPAVAGGKVYVFDYLIEDGTISNNPSQRNNLKGSERLIAFDEQTGKELWTHTYECPYSISYACGPRCTPTVDGDRVYILGSEGDLSCLNTKDGKLVWKKSFKKDFGAEVPIWGFSSHPLIDGDLLYTMVGGKGQGIVAFDKQTGDVKWKTLDCKAGYCPPVIIEKGGARQLIAFNPTSIESLDPADGKPYWSVPIESLYDMSITQPMLDGDFMYVCGKGNQSVMLKLDTEKPGATEVWRGKPRHSIYGANSTPHFVDGTLYGADQDMGSLIAADGKDGNRLWSTFDATDPEEDRKLSHGTAFLTRIGDTNRFLIMSETGDLLISELTPEKYISHGRFHVLEPTGECFGRKAVWSHPAYANKTAYVRNDEEIVAVDLSK
jgi:outer membrane protein assembly factor BamB